MARNFPEIGVEFREGLADPTDHGYIIPAMGYKNPGPTANLRGVEANTARGVKETPVIKDITPVTYGAASDAPVVDPFKTYGDN
jgi:hypothetical protein